MRCPAWVRLCLVPLVLPFVALPLTSCGSGNAADYDPKLQYVNEVVSLPDPLANYPMTGDLTPLRDPAIIHVGGTYYVFSTDVDSALDGNHIPIRCSPDAINWKQCGSVFTDRPSGSRMNTPASPTCGLQTFRTLMACTTCITRSKFSQRTTA